MKHFVGVCCKAHAMLMLLATAISTMQVADARAGSRRLAVQANPVPKVIKLLKDMKEQLEKEADGDQVIYDKMMCWCETNNKDKAQMIKDAEARISDLETVIESSAANSARLQQELTNHKEDLTKSQNSLDTATALRNKQLEEFNAEEKDMLQSIKALDAAIVVLSKHYQKTALTASRTAVKEAADVAYVQMQSHSSILLGVFTPHQKRAVQTIRQTAAASPALISMSYQPQSGEIFGILKQMKETFEQNLAETQQEEAKNKKSYEDVKTAKMDEIKATQAAIDQKTVQLAASISQNAQAKQDIEDTKKSLQVDGNFLLDVKKKCANTQTEWELRTKLRGGEISAIAEAIAILNSDEARDTFSKTARISSDTSLIQLMKVRRIAGDEKLRKGAVDAITSVAAKSTDPRLVALALSARIDPFVKVKKAIDDMVTDLLQEKQLESQKRDQCIADLNDNVRETEREQRNKADLESKAEGLKISISDLQAEVDALNTDIQEMTRQIKEESANREQANSEYQSIISDHREAQVLLKKALTVLEAKYKELQIMTSNTQSLLMVKKGTQPEPAPEGFSTSYKPSGGGNGVIALLTQILNDSKRLESEATKDEQDAQVQYEGFVKDTNASILAKHQSINDKTRQKTTMEQNLIQTKEDIQSKAQELQQLGSTSIDLHTSCDFIIKNFQIRQEARDQEVEALRQAKAILSGMQSGSQS